MLTFYSRYNSKKFGDDGGPLHDPTTIAWLIKPDLFRGKKCNVEIEIKSDLTRGSTVIDWWGVTNRPKNALVINEVDSDGFFELLTERVSNLK
jgi:purine nucleosidase